MARLMLSAGMFSAFAAAMAVRKRGLESGSPPPFLAAMLISLIRRVKILPRLASSAPFLCLIVAHFEWPDMHIPHVFRTWMALNSPVRTRLREVDICRLGALNSGRLIRDYTTANFYIPSTNYLPIISI